MRMFLLPVLTVSVIGQSICCQNLNAQDVDPLEIVPGNTAALVRLAVPEKTLNSVEAFVNKVQPGFGALAKAQAMGGLGQAIYNPSFKGADLKKDWYAGVIVENQATQHVFLLIPTTNADELKTATGDEFRSAPLKLGL